MLNISIDNPELEKKLKQAYGDDEPSMTRAFCDFIEQQKIKYDIGISIKQFDAGDSIPLKKVMNNIRVKYE